MLVATLAAEGSGPYLSSACAPLRLLIQGNMRQWQVYALEDMRLLSHSQLHEPLGESDWNFHLFGVRPNDVMADQVPSVLDGDPDGPRGSSSRARRSAAAAQPAAPLAPSEKENGGRSSAPDSFEPPPEAGVEHAEEGEEEESFDAVRPEQGPETLKPLFDFKKVFKRLQSGMIESDPVTAKRLLLGLRERFYHAPIGDFKNMLLRAGMSSDILPLAEEAVMSCSICRKYVRLPNRPQVKIGAGAGIFNHRIQADLFEYKKVWILLIIDETTRFKAATSVMSKDFAEITRKMVEHWFTVYGAPMQLVMDQETGMMSHEAGKELERFGIDRVPKGTTSGDAGKQHTGTGLVERHVGLLELTMQKLEAELDRQGIAIMPHELAKECSMAHNQSLNYNGATPSMAVFGVLPRPVYQEDTDNVVAMAGALQTDIMPFERALRIRQTSLSMVQRAVAEDRVARANRSRPHQLRLSELVPGTTLVDYYREVNGDVGWRGPAELLKVSRELRRNSDSVVSRKALLGFPQTPPAASSGCLRDAVKGARGRLQLPAQPCGEDLAVQGDDGGMDRGAQGRVHYVETIGDQLLVIPGDLGPHHLRGKGTFQSSGWRRSVCAWRSELCATEAVCGCATVLEDA